MKKFLLSILLAVLTPLLMLAEGEYNLVGGDISLLPSYEQYNTPYKDQQGKTISDLVTYAATTLRWNACRVRLFVNPCIINAETNSRQGEVQDLEYITGLCSRIKAAGMSLLLDFHYSDTWADPVKQFIPAAWETLSDEAMADTLYAYTHACLEHLVANDATPDYVQIGNEVSYGMLWHGTWRTTNDRVFPSRGYDQYATQWERFSTFLGKGAQAVREVCPEAKIIIHIERTPDKNACVNFYSYLNRNEVDYDIIGLSYYPFWHGLLTQELPATLTALHNAHPDKPIQIVETAYYNSNWPSDGISYDTRDLYPATPQGQAAYLTDLITTLQQYSFVNGLYYWFPEENGNGGASYSASRIVIDGWVNRGLFDPSSHKAYPGLYALAAYNNMPDAVQSTTVDGAGHDGIYYSLLGVPVSNDITSLPAGVYICNGKQVLVK